MFLIVNKKYGYNFENKKIYILDKELPAEAALVIGLDDKFKKIPASWDLEKLLIELKNIIPLKRGIDFALYQIREGEIKNIKDKNIKNLIAVASELLDAPTVEERIAAANELLTSIDNIKFKYGGE